MGATEKIARFIVDTGYEDIPRDAVEKAKRTALDCMGAALAGVVEPVGCLRPEARSGSGPAPSPTRARRALPEAR